MKRIFSLKKKIWIPLLLIALLATTGLSTFAYLSVDLGTLTNKITIATVTTNIEEAPPTVTGTVINKAPSVKNTGTVDCLVRVRINVSPETLSTVANFNFNTTKWVKIGDFYYYQGVVKPNTTSESIFTRITGLTDSSGKFLVTTYPAIKDFQVTVYQEAVQAVVYKNGTKISALKADGSTFDAIAATTIWAIYDGTQ